MYISQIALLLPLLAPAVALPSPSASNGTVPDKVIVVPLTAKSASQHPLPHRNRMPSLEKRYFPFAYNVHATDQHMYYQVNVDIGSPPQSFQCLLDTGSSDLWVTASQNPSCKMGNGHGCPYGSFTRSHSTTWRINSTAPEDNFHVAYADETYADGVWGTDVISVDGLFSLEKCSFGVATNGSTTLGVFGVGLPSLESVDTDYYYGSSSSSSTSSKPYTYLNVPALLANEGLIGRNAYSLYLGDRHSHDGKVIFGGVDICAHSGSLTTLPLVSIYSSDQTPDRLAIELTSFEIFSGRDRWSRYPDFSKSVSYPAVLDSGTAFTYLPAKLAKKIYAALQATPDSSVGSYVARCNQGGKLQFGFNGANIKVPFTEFMFPIQDDDGYPVTNRYGQPMCGLGIVNLEASGSHVSHTVLGANFLHSAYVLFDLDYKEISLAQAVRNPSCTFIKGLPDPKQPVDLSKRNGTLSSSSSNAAAAAVGVPDPAVAATSGCGVRFTSTIWSVTLSACVLAFVF